MVADLDLAQQTLERIHDLQNAGSRLLDLADKNEDEFCSLAAETIKNLEQLEELGKAFSGEEPHIKLHLHCACMKVSLQNIKDLLKADKERCRIKIEFEFLCMARGAYVIFYYWATVYPDPEKIKSFKEEMMPLFENQYVKRSIESGNYKYQVSFTIRAYNKLDYTKICVENLLKNIPDGLNYELILINHGSSDGTKEYFESIHPTKQIDIAINGGDCTLMGFIEGEYVFNISNDVVINENSIQNMLKCIQSDERIAWVVPSTSNVSNLQMLSASYNNFDEMKEFAKKIMFQTHLGGNSARASGRVKQC